MPDSEELFVKQQPAPATGFSPPASAAGGFPPDDPVQKAMRVRRACCGGAAQNVRCGNFRNHVLCQIKFSTFSGFSFSKRFLGLHPVQSVLGILPFPAYPIWVKRTVLSFSYFLLLFLKITVDFILVKGESILDFVMFSREQYLQPPPRAGSQLWKPG